MTISPHFRRWLVIQKTIIARGYQWANTPMIGVIFVSAVRMAFPALVDKWWKFLGLTIIGLAGIYAIGWLDKYLRLFHEENNYLIDVSPMVQDHLKEEHSKFEPKE